MKNQKIRTRFSNISETWENDNLEIRGRLIGSMTWLGIYLDDTYVAELDGQRLYRLAKAIVRRFEEDK